MGVGAISLLCGRFGLLHRGVWVVVHLHALPLITSASLLYLLRRELQEVSFFKRADEDSGPYEVRKRTSWLPLGGGWRAKRV